MEQLPITTIEIIIVAVVTSLIPWVFRQGTRFNKMENEVNNLRNESKRKKELLDKHLEKIEALEQKTSEHKGHLAVLESNLSALTHAVETLTSKVDRLYELVHEWKTNGK